MPNNKIQKSKIGRVRGIYLSNEIADKVVKDAEKSQRTESQVMRIIIENYYKQKEALAEVK